MKSVSSSKPRSRSTLAADLSAGLVVFLVALPLCLGVALASNAPLFSGILSGIVGGILVGTVSRSHTSVSGPAAGLTAVVAAQIATLGSFEAFLMAVALAGILQIVLGVIRAGAIADFVPSSVIKGLLAAIGLILILKQIPHLLGHDADPEGEMSFFQPDDENTFSELMHTLFGWDVHSGAALIGAFSMVLLVVWDRGKRWKKLSIPGPLVAVLSGVAMSWLLSRLGDDWAIEPSHLVQVPAAAGFTEFCGFLKVPAFTALANPQLYVAAVTIAIVSSLETLLNLEAVDKLDPQKRVSPPNRELIAQGVGNITAGLIGGLPVTSVIVRSSVNINSGGKSKLATIVHGSLLLLCVALFPTGLNQIPLSCLAGVLIMTGFKLASPKVFKQMWRAGMSQFLPFAVTVVAILLTDLLIGILIGLAFGVLFILRSNLRRPLRPILEKHIDREVLHIELASQVSFLNRVAIRQALDSVPRNGHVLIDARFTDYIDADVLALILEYDHEIAPARGVEVSLVGFKDHYQQLEDRIRYVDYGTRDLQESLSPDQVLEILRDGNQRFRDNQPLSRNLIQSPMETANGGHPLAVVLSGASSRVPIELIFDVGPGNVFCTRVTGNLASPAVLGSLEHACVIAGAKLIVVMGHTDNKAVRMAIDSLANQTTVVCENLQSILTEIQRVVDPNRAATWATMSPDEKKSFINDVARQHVQRTVESITERSSVLRQLDQEERIKVVGSMYDVFSGNVDFLASPSRRCPLDKTPRAEAVAPRLAETI